MRKAILVVLVAVILGLVVYVIRPASVSVGSVAVSLQESRGSVLFKNIVGDFLGYGRCEITGLSFYWAPFTGLKYAPSMGVIFSNYAIETLMQMSDQQKAYNIAQKAFDRLQKSSWGSHGGNKLSYPLQLL